MNFLTLWPRSAFAMVLLLVVTAVGLGERQRSGVCDLEALRCDIICAFDSLVVPCQRCGQRRPMRFGKRGMSSRKRPGDAKRGHKETENYNSLDVDQATDNEADRLKTSYLGTVFTQEEAKGEGLQAKGRLRQPSTLFVANSPLIKGLLVNASSLFIPRVEEENRQPEHRGYANLRIHSKGMLEDRARDEEKFDYEDDVDYDFERRTDFGEVPVAKPSEAFSANRVKRQSGTLAGPGPLRRARRYLSARDMVEGLLELLGLKKLPIDPRLYGCHHLFDQYYG